MTMTQIAWKDAKIDLPPKDGSPFLAAISIMHGVGWHYQIMNIRPPETHYRYAPAKEGSDLYRRVEWYDERPRICPPLGPAVGHNYISHWAELTPPDLEDSGDSDEASCL